MKTYHKNPRTIKDKQFNDLRAWLLELGDLSGIVHDLTSDEVISGNQRMRAIDVAKCEIVLTEGPHDPDAQGTVAHGYVIWQGAKYNYRQVRWDARQCEKANIVANKAGGSWDFDILANEWDAESLIEWGFEPGELGIVPSGDEWGNALSGLPDSDRAPFQQMTFTLHDEQVEQVKRALTIAGKVGDFTGSPNENSHGNALAFMAEAFITDYGDGR